MSLIGETKLAILRHLQNAPAHGYAIADALDISHGGVYTHLQELEDAGMIKVTEERQEGRQQEFYTLTENGELLLRALEDE